jgi:hypothetical protein
MAKETLQRCPLNVICILVLRGHSPILSMGGAGKYLFKIPYLVPTQFQDQSFPPVQKISFWGRRIVPSPPFPHNFWDLWSRADFSFWIFLSVFYSYALLAGIDISLFSSRAGHCGGERLLLRHAPLQQEWAEPAQPGSLGTAPAPPSLLM